ncbi:unnamed protein product [Boreogadus saida]
MKFKKFITIMQAAMGVVPLNKRELLPPGRKLWRPQGEQPGPESPPRSRSDLLTSSRSWDRFHWTREAHYLYLRRLSSSRSYSAITQMVNQSTNPITEIAGPKGTSKVDNVFFFKP